MSAKVVYIGISIEYEVVSLVVFIECEAFPLAAFVSTFVILLATGSCGDDSFTLNCPSLFSPLIGTVPLPQITHPIVSFSLLPLLLQLTALTGNGSVGWKLPTSSPLPSPTTSISRRYGRKSAWILVRNDELHILLIVDTGA